MNNVYQKYKQSMVQSASREKILLMLYEGAIKFTKLAQKACDEKNIADRGLYIGKTYDIIMELSNTLDHKVGGQISSQLEQLYMFIMDELTKANVRGDKSHLDTVLKLLNTLYDGWVVAIEKLKSQENGVSRNINEKA